MASTDTLEAVAEMLPPDRRLRFLAMVTRFRSVPEDDEYLQILEAIGFMTLLWKEVPDEIRRVIAAAAPADTTTQGAAEILRATVREAVPSYDDLKRIVQRLESHEQLLVRAARSAHPAEAARPGGWRCILFFGLGVAVALITLEIFSR